MNLAVITPCIYPSTNRISHLTQSCQRYGIELRPHGVGEQFADWRTMLLRHTLPHMRELMGVGFTHVLYVDAIDTIFVATLQEIAAKYELMGSPNMLFSGDSDIPLSGSENWTMAGPWHFPNAGAYMGIIHSFVDMWERLAEKYPEEGNYQRWVEQTPFQRIMVDVNCNIFQSMDGHPAVMPCGERVINAVTATWPCVLHFRGGYCDPQFGRFSRMRPWMEAFERAAKMVQLVDDTETRRIEHANDIL